LPHDLRRRAFIKFGIAAIRELDEVKLEIQLLGFGVGGTGRVPTKRIRKRPKTF
jgi:hypothetical protein